MAIYNFSSLNNFQPSAATKYLLSDVNTFLPTSKGVYPKWTGHPTIAQSFIEVPTAPDIELNGRGWIRVQAAPGYSSSLRFTQFAITNADIDPELAVPGNIVSYSFKFAAATVYASTGATYLGYRLPSATAVTSMVAIPGVTITANQYRWIDFRFTYNEDLTTLVEIFTNKVLVYSFVAAAGTLWGVSAGNFSNSILYSTTASHGFYLNDFLTVVDKIGAEDNTGLIGPITVKTLPVATARMQGTWTPPAGQTVLEALNNKRLSNTLSAISTNMIRSDSLNGTLTTTFKYPEAETKPILAMQEVFIAQKPESESSVLNYQRIENGKLIGTKKTFTTDLTTDAVVVSMDIVLPNVGETSITPEQIEARGMVFNSTKKTIASDA